MDEQRFFDLIHKLPDNQAKLDLLLLFLEEVGGMINHLEAVGCSWGAGGEEAGAYAEKIKFKRIAQGIKNEIVRLVV